MRTRLLNLLLSVLTGSAVLAPGAPAAEPRLLLDANFPDPDVNRFGSHYYGYATGTRDTRAPVATAPSPAGPWRARGDALPERPAWMARKSGIWAPDVVRRADGDYLMYFSGARGADGTMCIGAAVAGSPLGPFRPVGRKPVVCDPRDDGNIDPAAFTTADGRRFLLYKANGHEGEPAILYLQRVGPGGIRPVGDRVELLRADHPDEHGIVEAPTLVRLPSRYVLFYSADHFTSPGYRTTYATAPALTGPYTKSGAPFISRRVLGANVDGPGSADVLPGPGGTHAFFHAWRGPDRGYRALYTVEMHFDNGRPVLGGS
ncbi:glycosyl hydrolase family 43 [Prauserella shujinwangii]|uniref:Glycosyl hydrolase family 43 n=1 Tax=Prauserella shujinwangii TaxID=1453103 RepID=A0A2T0LLK8_9PSEU|nr:glycoside hydrolase family 43 protein [Prauserella shujinwangii]PRX43878.1 glycosyl hydrolase family 43 [Prauserella shujinwangii]